METIVLSLEIDWDTSTMVYLTRSECAFIRTHQIISRTCNIKQIDRTEANLLQSANPTLLAISIKYLHTNQIIMCFNEDENTTSNPKDRKSYTITSSATSEPSTTGESSTDSKVKPEEHPHPLRSNPPGWTRPNLPRSGSNREVISYGDGKKE